DVERRRRAAGDRDATAAELLGGAQKEGRTCVSARSRADTWVGSYVMVPQQAARMMYVPFAYRDARRRRRYRSCARSIVVPHVAACADRTGGAVGTLAGARARSARSRVRE